MSFCQRESERGIYRVSGYFVMGSVEAASLSVISFCLWLTHKGIRKIEICVSTHNFLAVFPHLVSEIIRQLINYTTGAI